MKTLAIIFFTLTSFSGFAQQGKLSGEITSEGSIVAFANVYIKASALGTTADKEGKFLLKNIPAGNHSIEISAIGFKKFSRDILINEGQSKTLNVQLEKSSEELNEVLIVDTQTGLTRRTPYNVSSIDMRGIETKGNP